MAEVSTTMSDAMGSAGQLCNDIGPVIPVTAPEGLYVHADARVH